MKRERIVIIGAGLCGATAAGDLRDRGFHGEVHLIGEEPQQPYNRPPLSKGYLRGQERFEDMLVHPPGFYAERNITRSLGVRAAGIDAQRKAVRLESGEEILYDQLLVTTGRLSGRLSSLFMYTASVSPEQEMAFMLERIGPVIAIGKPGEPLPELGAARRYVGDDEWRAVVGQMMNDAVLVVIRAGETANLWWETHEALTRCSPERVIIVALGPAETFTAFERRFTEAYGAPATTPAPPSRIREALLRLAFPYARSGGKIIYFD